MRGIYRTTSMFYTLFKSKEALHEALIGHEMALSIARFSPSTRSIEESCACLEDGETLGTAPGIDAWIEHVLMPYLSRCHVDAPGEGCALPALSTDIARCDIHARRRYEQALLHIVAECKRITGCCDSTAWAAVTQCIGAVVVARTIASDNVRDAVLQSAAGSVKLMITMHRHQDS